jgi:hypothetical protein
LASVDQGQSRGVCARLLMLSLPIAAAGDHKP